VWNRADRGREDDVGRMRAFVAAVLRGEPSSVEPPPDLVRLAHMGPLAYRMGYAEHRAEYAACAIQAERRRALVGEVAGALHQRGVRAFLVKGIAHAGVLYPDPAERPMHDIDLLVEPRALPDAIRGMHALGFSSASRPRARSGYYHAVTLVRGDMLVELHRGIVQHGRTGIRMAELWRRALPEPALPGAERLEPIDDLLVTCLHVARHELHVPAINYVDVARALERRDASDLRELEARARRYGVGRPLAAVLAMTELLRAGATGRPASGGLALVLPTTECILLGRVPSRVLQLARKMVLTEGTRSRAALGFAYGKALVDGWWRSRR
jgi:hypothetical protein